MVFLISAVIVSGCAGLLEADRLVESRNVAPPYEGSEDTEERIEISSYAELMDAVLVLIMGYEDGGKYVIHNYDSDDIQADINRVEREIVSNHPIGAYAVSNITGVTRRVVSYTEVDITIEYRRAKEQVDSIVNVSTLRYLRTELLSSLSDYHDEVVFQTTLNITEQQIREHVRETYYQNPRYIIMLPGVAIETFPRRGEVRIVELRFGYIEQTSILRNYSASLTSYVRRNAELAVGENDGEILISLAENLIASTRFDIAAARSISEHGTQNFAATAFGALVRQEAVGEGFAMAFKALSDELGFDCRIVTGYVDDMVHAWNIVSLGGDYYHIDVAMSALNGIETAFLKTDDDFLEMLYLWDFDNTVRCNGLLVYEDFIYSEDIDNPELLDNPESFDDDNPENWEGNEPTTDLGNPEDAEFDDVPEDTGDTVQ